jgi:hypothetical protein
MRAAYRWLVASSLFVPLVIACGAASSGGLSGGQPGGDDGSSSSGSSGGSSSGLGGGGSGGSSSGVVFHVPPPDAQPKGVMLTDSACKAGFYSGGFNGSYSSNLAIGIPLVVSGNVELTLDQEGSSQQQCTVMVQGEGLTTEKCSDLFTLSGGTITGVANPLYMNDSGTTIGGFPYFCNMTGTLDCANSVLDDGWIECTYCAFSDLEDGGQACTGLGGHFAGPLTANYDTSTLSFTGGTWNGAEALCDDGGCNDGGPLPNGMPASTDISADGGYKLLGPYGGAGTWQATCLNCATDN